ncbi:MAG: hypothetical protein J5742_01950 [Alphaproteobacteria bacterium]|nr:hypothetical protein [Alphaproteobacteria bacterium]
MKKLIIFIFGIAVFTGANAAYRVYEPADLYPCDGEEYKHLSCTKVGSVVDGVVQEHFESGQLKTETPYRGGQKHGLAREYYENVIPNGQIGRIKRETNYEYGATKIIKEYYNTGSIRLIINHDTGKLQEYKENGELRIDRETNKDKTDDQSR